MKPILLAVAACALASPTVTSAQLVLGGQAGVVMPRGDLDEGRPLDGEIKAAVPLELRVGWRIAPAIVVGLQGGYAFASEGDARDSLCRATAADCKTHLWKLAARGEHGFGGELWRPFVAATLGGEWLFEREEPSADTWRQTTWAGWLAALEAGVERPLATKLRGGAFVVAGLGQYRSARVKGATAGYAYEDTGAVTSPAAHFWLGVGLRAAWDVFGE